MNTNIEKMLELITGAKRVTPPKVHVGAHISVDGFIVDSANGRVVRRDLTLDQCKPYEHQPLYVYCRASRFENLIRNAGVPLKKQTFCLHLFCQLEEAWLQDKKVLGNRKYFLSQRLILSEICRLNNIKYKFTNKQPIRDKRRCIIQQKLFSDLLKASLDGNL